MNIKKYYLESKSCLSKYNAGTLYLFNMLYSLDFIVILYKLLQANVQLNYCIFFVSYLTIKVSFFFLSYFLVFPRKITFTSLLAN